MLVVFTVLYHRAMTHFSWQTPEESAKKAELCVPQDICSLKSSSFPLVFKMGMLPQTLNYKISEAAIPPQPRSVFLSTEHSAHNQTKQNRK